MIDFEPEPALVEIRDLAREFAAKELRPAEADIDAIPDPAEAFRSEPFRRILRRIYEMGLHKLTIPAERGGLGLPPLASHLVLEELACGGAGLASHVLVAPIPAFVINMFGLEERSPIYKEYLGAFIDDGEGAHSGAWAITEPGVGSDFLTFGRDDIHLHTQAVATGDARAPTVAVREGGGYRIDGAKSAFVSNGYLADFVLLMASVDPGSGMAGSGVFLVPGDLHGISRGKPLDKLGLRALNQAEIYFDSVWVPEEFLVLPPGPQYQFLLEAIVTSGNTAVGQLALGVARAAYEGALAYAKERVQGGRPIAEHQLVAMKLFDAFRSTEAARALLWKSAWLIGRGTPDVRIAMAARTVACEMAMRVTAEMAQVMGGYGISREYPLEKLYRDAKLLTVMDGTVERVSLYAASRL